MFTKYVVCGLSLAVLAGALSGCTDGRGATVRTFGLNSNESGISAATNAQARVIVHNDRAGAALGQGKATKVVCVEPSPDVASALNTALTISAQLTKNVTAPGGASSNLSASGGFGLGMAESVIQLGERLAVIQLLRDKMYRACEAYGNGAITQEAYTLILARMDKTMASLLSAEMAAGAFGRKLASAGGTAAAGGVDPLALQKAQEKLNAAIKVVDDKAKKTPAVAASADEVKAIQTAADELSKLELLILRASSTSTATTAAITANTQNGTAAVLAIHREYLNDSGVEPLIDACLTTLSLHNSDQGKSKSISAGILALSNAEKDVALAQQLQQSMQMLQSADTNLDNMISSVKGDIEEGLKALKSIPNVSFGKVCEDILTGNTNGGIVTHLMKAKENYLLRVNERAVIEASGQVMKGQVQAHADLVKAKLVAVQEAMKACNVSAGLRKDADAKDKAAQACQKAADAAMKDVMKQTLPSPSDITIQPVEAGFVTSAGTPEIKQLKTPKVTTIQSRTSSPPG